MNEEDLTNPKLIELAEILEEPLEEILFGDFEFSLGSFYLEGDDTESIFDTQAATMDDDDFFNLILEQGDCSPLERDFLEWLIGTNSHRKPLAFSLIFEREE